MALLAQYPEPSQCGRRRLLANIAILAENCHKITRQGKVHKGDSAILIN